MKATEMLDTWKPQFEQVLRSNDNAGFVKAWNDCTNAAINEYVDMVHARRIKFCSSHLSLVKECNTKFNKFAGLLNEALGGEVFPRESFLVCLWLASQRQKVYYTSREFPIDEMRKGIAASPMLQKICAGNEEGFEE